MWQHSFILHPKLSLAFLYKVVFEKNCFFHAEKNKLWRYAFFTSQQQCYNRRVSSFFSRKTGINWKFKKKRIINKSEGKCEGRRVGSVRNIILFLGPGGCLVAHWWKRKRTKIWWVWEGQVTSSHSGRFLCLVYLFQDHIWLNIHILQ